jgi:hypothetical protein
MIKIIFYISIIFLLYYCIRGITEKFEANIYDNTNCCVIRKKRLGAKFVYTYNTTKYCDDYNDNFLRTIKEGESIAGEPFQMNQCVDNKKFGSCRQMGGFTCVDFVTKEECIKYPDLVWNLTSCNNTLPYKNDKYYKSTEVITQI